MPSLLGGVAQLTGHYLQMFVCTVCMLECFFNSANTSFGHLSDSGSVTDVDNNIRKNIDFDIP